MKEVHFEVVVPDSILLEVKPDVVLDYKVHHTLELHSQPQVAAIETELGSKKIEHTQLAKLS